MLTAFFAAKHEALKNDYRDGDGLHPDSCTHIALEVTRRLLEEGRSPRIFAVLGERVCADGSRAELTPLPYEGRVRWGAHVICEAAGVVYDPMFAEPIAMADYLTAAFAQPVEITELTGLFQFDR